MLPLCNCSLLVNVVAIDSKQVLMARPLFAALAIVYQYSCQLEKTA